LNVRKLKVFYETALLLSGKIGPIFALALVMLIFGSMEPERFFSPRNLGSVAGQTAVIAIAAIGMTYVIISAGIDLSVGSLVALTGIFSTMAISSLFGGGDGFSEAGGGLSPLICIAAGIGVGVLTGIVCGFMSGAAITYGKLPPFIVTLGMLEILRGTALQSAGGLPVTGLPEAFAIIGNKNLMFGDFNTYIPLSMFILIPLALIAGYILKYTVFGTHVYAIGSNEQTAKLCGVNVNRTKIMVYVICGFTAALAGILQASRLRTGQPSTGVGLELDIIAAVVVGGGSLMGGEGTILGSIVGAFIIRFLRNGCVLVDISPFAQRIIIGIIIIAAVFIDQLRRRHLAAKAQSNR
jgi:ribose transport system permease protein